MLNFLIYSRKSIYSERGDSIKNQIEFCRAYISLHFPDTPPEKIRVFEDEGYSGKNTDRPQFQQMLSEIRQGNTGYVVCYRLDRISRSVGNFCGLVDLLQEQNTGLICVREEFNTATPTGRAMMYMASIFAQLERETIGERVKDNLTLLARTGRWLGGPRPTGFLPERVRIAGGEKEKYAYRLTPVSGELHTVSQAYAQYLKTGALSAVVRNLSAYGARTKGGRPFSIPSLKLILRNPVYATAAPEVYDYLQRRGACLAFDRSGCDGVSGLMPYHRSTVRDGKKVLLDYTDWIVSIGAHNGVIAGTDWVQVQELLDKRSGT